MAQRARANPAPVASVAVTVLVVCTLVSGLVASLGLLQRDALRSALAGAAPGETVLAVSAPYDADDPAAQDAALREALAGVTRVAGGDVVSVATSGTYDLAGAPDGAGFAAVTGADPLLVTESGTLPSAGGARLEVAAPAGSDLAVGDEAVLTARTGDRVRVPVTVVGTWSPDPDGERWLGDLDPTALLVDPADFAAVGGPGSLARWRAVPDLAALAPDRLAQQADAVAAGVTEVEAAGTSVGSTVQADSGLAGVLADRARELTVLRSLLLVPAGLLVLVAAAGLLLVASGLAGVRREEESLLRSRGAGYRQLSGPTVLETLVVCGGAALVAPLLAAAVVRIGDVRPPLEPAAWLGSGVAAAVCAVALGVPVVVRAVGGDRGQQLAVERQRRRTLTLLVTALLVVSGLGALAVVTLRGFGDTVGAASVDTATVDPLLVASPALLLLALAALAAALLLPALLRLVAAAVAGRGVPLAVGTRFAARSPATAVPVALATTLAVGTLAFASVERASSAAARDDRAAYVAGADVRVTAPTAAARAGAAAEQEALAGVPGVESVTAVRRSGTFLDDLPAEVLVTDTTDDTTALFGDRAGSVDVAALRPDGGVGNGEAPDVLPVALTEDLAAEAGLGVGDTLTLTVLGAPTSVEVAATVPYVRTVPDGSGAVLLDSAVAVPALGDDAGEPAEWWLGVADGRADAVAAALAGRPEVAREVLTTADVLRRLDDDPSTGGAALGEVLLLTGAGCLLVGGLLLLSVVLLRRRERAAQAWMLQTAGAARRDLLGVVGWEYAVVTGTGAVVGVLAGTLVAALTLVSMTLGPDGQLLVPAPELVLPWPLLLGAPLLMIALPLLGLLALTGRDHDRVLAADAVVGGAR